MKTKKYYAIRQGKKVGIFETWDEAKSYVTGYKGAEYKSFKTLEEAKAYLNNENLESKQIEGLKEDEIIAYVDGSYNIESKKFGYGIVLLKQDQVSKFNGAMFDESLSEQRNVAGEVFGSMEAIDMAIEMGMKKIYIHFDYMGIKAWALGEWKTNIELTKNYKKFIDDRIKKIDIDFIKVKAHSNNKYNDMADKLAKEAVGIK